MSPEPGALRDALVRELGDPARLDPLLAEQAALALERLGDLDAELIHALRERAAGGGRASARAPLLTVDRTGRGLVAELVLDLCPGDRGPWTWQGHADDSKGAVQVGVATALRAESHLWSTHWQVAALDGQPVALEGSSVGLAAAVATRCARDRRDLRGWCFTGQVDPDGRVRGVRQLKAKLEAASKAGFRGVVAPREDVDRLPEGFALAGLEVVPVEELVQVWRLLDRVAPAPPDPPARRATAHGRRALRGLAAGVALLLVAGVVSSRSGTERAPDLARVSVCLVREGAPVTLERPVPEGSAQLTMEGSVDGAAWLYFFVPSPEPQWVLLAPQRGESPAVTGGERRLLPPFEIVAEGPEDLFALVWSPGAVDGDPWPLLDAPSPSAEALQGALPGVRRWLRRRWSGGQPCATAAASPGDAVMLEIPVRSERVR